jgi:hypothetical protein
MLRFFTVSRLALNSNLIFEIGSSIVTNAKRISPWSFDIISDFVLLISGLSGLGATSGTPDYYNYFLLHAEYGKILCLSFYTKKFSSEGRILSADGRFFVPFSLSRLWIC